ncbi:MAG TPA: tRNA epoxyqueuosine(34) reductase QueG [Trinickia sp.]|jgi:epoxyqueuosine reductase|uniref:tRNA epoxyqueuosine(34) reductase QueG n=1 Tax=Trinickia sp. TaxID=2571163 RepID=UPI002C9D8CFE|nr:tRNA epoxyqueuosine(34) reductase QueG [Trinickia sp.]HTI17769.1 tRNA epoxyqueuosine(34) reductase QueG [Trinickia sp.]
MTASDAVPTSCVSFDPQDDSLAGRGDDALPAGTVAAASVPDAADRLDARTLAALATRIKAWGRELGFGAIGISDTDLSAAEAALAAWLEAGCHGEMDYMAKHGMKRARPAELVAGTLRVITARMAYLPASTIAGGSHESTPSDSGPGDWRARERSRLADPMAAVVSVYARGRDYHKVMRQRLQQLAERIERDIGPYGHRVFTDSAPVLEVELAQKGNIGWRGKHTLLIERDAGSFFFLGEIYVDIALPIDAPVSADALGKTHAGDGAAIDADDVIDSNPEGAISRARFDGQLDAGVGTGSVAKGGEEGNANAGANAKAAVRPVARQAGAHCGHCTRCIDACPTGAIVGPFRVDARRCVSYLTIELKGSIPEALRPLIGNRVYGCDDCQLVCPWNKFAQAAPVGDFDARHGLDRSTLVDLFAWSAEEFDARMQGSAIRRIGYECWLRNLAVGLGNALRADAGAALAKPDRERIVDALRGRADDASPLVREHVQWALQATSLCAVDEQRKAGSDDEGRSN